MLKSGDRVIETTVANELNLSCTPVGDAIRRLEAEGLLDYEPRSGLVVTTLNRGGVAVEHGVAGENVAA
jgi:DNA-binding GntR family transcriptional regulator